MQGVKIGILGGGQLGSMLIRSAIDFGLTVAVLDKSPEAPCARYTSSFVCGDPLSYDDVVAFGKELDVITIEMEAVNVAALKQLASDGKKVFPRPELIEAIQDKYIQKQLLQSKGMPVVPGEPVAGRAELYSLAARLPGCLKTRRSGYDGYGVKVLRSAADIDAAFDAPCVLEELVAIKHELSVIVARNESGAVTSYDPVLMMFNSERFVLDFQLCPAGISDELAAEARSLACRVAEELELVGILAVEMFVTEDGKLLVNELAPRPHNSGHHTIEACVTSQYEQLVRAITGLPLGDTKVNSASAMVNILAPNPGAANKMQGVLNALLGMPDVHVHWYGKSMSKEGRKIGHVTILADTIDNALETAHKVRNTLTDIK